MVVALMAVSFGAGTSYRTWKTALAQVDSSFPLLQEAIAFVEGNYVKEQPEEETVEYALIRAYLAQLGDPNTFFIEPAVAASESQVLAGRYGGIGADVQRNEAGEFVLYPYEDSPATRAGLLPEDILLAVNDQPINPTSSVDEIRQALRGEIKDGAGVKLLVRNSAETEEREYFILFEEILVPSVTWRTLLEAPEIGYINISRFTNRTPDEFAQAVNELREANITSLVLDLRNNGGGLLQESLRIAGQFFDNGTLLMEKRVTGDTTIPDEPGGLVLDWPIAVLVNSGTASASEIVAGALQARDRAVLVGQKTYGKGSIQSIFPLSDGSSIHVTVALWFTPDGGVLEGAGLEPDITMIPDENGRDVELGEAVRILQSGSEG
jgi:carboxyl-terminal processing protease